MTKGADPIAPGGEHNSQDGVGLDPADTDDAEGELPAETPVTPEAPAPAEEAPLPPEPPAGKAPGLAAGVAAELVAANAEVIEGKLTPPYWPVRAVPAACGVAAVCAPAGLDTTTASGKRMRAVMFRITELRSLVITMSMTRSRRPEAPAPLHAICGVRRIHPRPRAILAANGEHANAVGAAIAQVNGEADQVYHDLDPRRAIAAAEVRTRMRRRRRRRSQNPETVDVDDMPLALCAGKCAAGAGRSDGRDARPDPALSHQ